jgi:hypothetical protein
MPCKARDNVLPTSKSSMIIIMAFSKLKDKIEVNIKVQGQKQSFSRS